MCAYSFLLLLLLRQLCSAIQSLAKRLFMDMAKNENDTPELVDYKLRVHNTRSDAIVGKGVNLINWPSNT